MPLVVYPPEISQTSHTGSLTRYTTSGTCSGGTVHSVPDTQTYYSRYDVRTARGWTTPGWRKMRNSGAILPMTEWRRFQLNAECQLGQREYCTNSNTRRFVWSNWYHSTPSIVTLDESYYMDKVQPYDLEYYVQKAAAAIYSSGWDAATFLAEIGQLRRMLSGIGKKVDDLSKGQSPGKLHDLWLEGRYGWRTLMYDIEDLHEVLTTANERRTRYREAKGFTDSGSWNESYDSNSVNITTNTSNDISWVMNLRGTVVADIDVPDFQFNPVTTAWEITKLSFVVDWLLNVGQALEAASFLLKAKAYKACGGIKVTFRHEGAFTLVGGFSGTNALHSDNAWSADATFIERVPMSVSALPHMKLRLDEWKVIDLLALVAQRLR